MRIGCLLLVSLGSISMNFNGNFNCAEFLTKHERTKRTKRIEWNKFSSVVDVADCSYFAGFIASMIVFLTFAFRPLNIAGFITGPPSNVFCPRKLHLRRAKQGEARRIFNGAGGRRASQTN